MFNLETDKLGICKRAELITHARREMSDHAFLLECSTVSKGGMTTELKILRHMPTNQSADRAQALYFYPLRDAQKYLQPCFQLFRTDKEKIWQRIVIQSTNEEYYIPTAIVPLT